MALRLQIEIAGSPVFKFDVPPTFAPRLSLAYKRASNPQQIEQIRTVWELDGARIVANDSTAFWAAWNAFRARFEPTANTRLPPASVRILRDDTAEVWKLAPTEYEQLQFELIEGAPSDPLVPAASWHVLGPVKLTVSAVKKFADPNGIVGWDQKVDTFFERGGLQVIRWVTTFETKEGTDARVKARAFGKIPLPSSFYTYRTNGTDGVNLEIPDSDEQNTRIPTVCTATCEIKQWGIDAGTTAAGTGPDEVGKVTRTRITPEAEETTVIYSATGPGYLDWVKGRTPVGDENDLEDDEGNRSATGTATTRRPRLTFLRTIQVEITGGHEGIDWEPVCDGFDPVEFVGGREPWTITISVHVEREGGTGSKLELPMPPLLPDPVRLLRNESREQEPSIMRHGASSTRHRWKRDAVLVYGSATKPSFKSVSGELSNKDDVESYYLT